MRHFIWIAAVVPGLAAADGFVPMDGAGITAALTGRELVYEDGATQTFGASGATTYDAGRPSWGRWAVRGDRYCSQWPPSDGWACYDMERNGDVLRFIADDGSITSGSYAE